jgi:hypothetical protein
MTDEQLAAMEERAALTYAGGTCGCDDDDVAALVAEVRRLRGLLRDAAAEHQQERLAWSDRKVELLERIVALEAQAKGAT